MKAAKPAWEAGNRFRRRATCREAAITAAAVAVGAAARPLASLWAAMAVPPRPMTTAAFKAARKPPARAAARLQAPSTYVKPFSDALTKLKKGEYTKTPVKTDFGYHVIALDDTRPLTPPPFEQVKPQLQQRASQQQVEQLVKKLRESAKVN